MKRTDKEIIQCVLDGDMQSFGTLIDRHKGKAMTLAIRILRNKQDAEEALQDAFVRMYRALPSFEWKSSFSTWMYRIVYNTCITAAGKRNAFMTIPLETEEEIEHGVLESKEPLPDIKMQSDEFVRALHEEIEKLPPAYGSTFTMFAVQELSYEEITQVTGLPLGTVKARIFRARMLLQEAVVKRLNPVLI